MSDSAMTTDDVVSRAEYEALLERVEALEAEIDAAESSVVDTISGIDHRDAAVAERLTVGETYSPRSVVRAYQNLTDITNRNTAENRARQFVTRFFDGRTFQGVDADE